MNLRIFALLMIYPLASCDQELHQPTTDQSVPVTKEIEPGYWLGKLKIDDENYIPFNFEVNDDSLFIINGEEKICTAINETHDGWSVKIPMFDSEFIFDIKSNKLVGNWYNRMKGDYYMPFEAVRCKDMSNRFGQIDASEIDFSGKWETKFSPGTDQAYDALGVFEVLDNTVEGTFLTETGDYRFLQGNTHKNGFKLSCFDGSHAFLFTFERKGDSLAGTFYSGKHWSEPFTAKRNSAFELTDPYRLTTIEKGEKLMFSFPDLQKNTITYPGPLTNGKVTIIQILGSWCPNCMDETAFLTSFYERYRNEGLEIIGVTFEIPDELDDKIAAIKSFKDFFGSNYTFVIGGEANKEVAAAAFPVLNHIISFPTTIIVDRKGNIRKVHTGFYGPGTGAYFERYAEDLNSFIGSLLREEV